MKRCAVILASAVLSISVWGTALAQTAVTECGQIVEGDAYLAADLDCTGFVSEHPTGAMIVLLSPYGRLDLRGFTLAGGFYGGVSCVKRCTPIPNTCGPYQIRPARCDVFDSVGGGVITGSSYGISAQSVLVQDVTISNHEFHGISAQSRLLLRNATVSGNNIGVDDESGTRHRLRVRAYDSTITGNAKFGIVGGSISLRDSTATGNGSIPGCDPQYPPNRCADLNARRRAPRLKNSTCETSTGKPYWRDGYDWGVCSLD